MELLTQTISYFSENQIELWGTIFGIICVWFNTKENIWGWPTGLISVGLYIYIFLNAGLYGDFLLHIIYVILGIYGWYHWLYGGKSTDALPVSYSSTKELSILVVIGTLGTLVMGYIFENYFGSDVPYWDAFTTSFSLIAQWQLAKKRIENWVIWIIVDVACVGIYFYKGLMFTTFLYFVYLFLASWGFIQWRKSYQQHKTEKVIA
ncbi:nicotinamide riboside transporter PnuC [Limibacter armeniacum]|uniref:nicotinamide riboside transporter PnuC n=1 Tax=Limibacter armeniacum TaxID=466084 RepID=UPI002FE615CF